MHRYRIIAQISLMLSVLNLVLAAPVVVREIHGTHGNEMVVAEDVAAMPKRWHELDVASDRSTSPRSPQPGDAIPSPQPEVGSTSSNPSQHEDTTASPQPEVGSTSSNPSQHEDTMASPQPEDGPPSSGSSQHGDAMGSPQHEDELSSSGYPTPHLSSVSSESGYSWLLDRPPRLSPHGPAPSMETASDRLPTQTLAHPDNAGFFSENAMKSVKALAAVTILGGAIAGIVIGSQHHNSRAVDPDGYVSASSLPPSRHFDNPGQKPSDL
jgi:hypothetical protein